MLSLTYHPSPQNLLERPQSPSFEQQAPHVGLQTKPSAPAQVPSTVTTPVCHGGTTSVAVPCATAHAGNSQKRANKGAFIFSCTKDCVMILCGDIHGTECMITSHIYRDTGQQHVCCSAYPFLVIMYKQNAITLFHKCLNSKKKN